MSALQLGPLTDSPADARDFCALSNSLYARPVDEAYYAWQFFRTPFRTRLFAARDEEGMLVGCLAVQARTLRPGGETLGQVIDIMVDRRAQGHGVFRELEAFARAELSDVDALVVMANPKANAACQRLGWTSVAAIRTHVAPAVTDRRLRHEFVPFDSFAAILPVLSALPDAVAPLVVSDRTAAVLDWRFVANPRYRYERFSAARGGAVRGYVVLKTFRDPVTQRVFGDIVDVGFVDTDPDLLRDLLAFALGHAASRGVTEAATWLQTNTALDDAAADAGFRAAPGERHFLARPLTPAPPALLRADQWYLTMFDSEVY